MTRREKSRPSETNEQMLVPSTDTGNAGQGPVFKKGGRCRAPCWLYSVEIFGDIQVQMSNWASGDISARLWRLQYINGNWSHERGHQLPQKEIHRMRREGLKH